MGYTEVHHRFVHEAERWQISHYEGSKQGLIIISMHILQRQVCYIINYCFINSRSFVCMTFLITLLIQTMMRMTMKTAVRIINFLVNYNF